MEIEVIPNTGSLGRSSGSAGPLSGTPSDDSPKKETKQDNSGVQEPKTETPAERKLRLKFGKSEREVSEKEAIALAQKGWASDEKFKSAKAAEREAQRIVDSADVEAMLTKKYGKSKLEWAKEVLKEELKVRTMSPEEKDEHDRKKRIEELKAEEESLLERKANERLEAQTQKYQEQYDREFAQALEKHKLPRNKYLMNRAVKIASELVANDMEPDWDLVVGEAKRQVQEEISEMWDDSDQALSWIGEDRLRKVMKLLVGKISNAKPIAKVVQQIDANKDNEKVPVDAEEYWEKKRQQWSK